MAAHAVLASTPLRFLGRILPGAPLFTRPVGSLGAARMSEAAEALAPATLLAQGGGGTEIVPSINPATTYARDRDTYAPIDGRIYSRAPL